MPSYRVADGEFVLRNQLIRTKKGAQRAPQGLCRQLHTGVGVGGGGLVVKL